MTKFRILGALEVLKGDRICTPTAPKLRQVLALLLLHVNQVVHLDCLIEELWDHDPPKSAVTTAQTYIYLLRQIFVEEGLDESASELLVTKQPGYVLRVEPEQVDSHAFQQLAMQGRAHLDNERPAEASRVLGRALDMWTDQALADVTLGRVLKARVLPLEEQRLRALELRIQADLRMGLHRELIGELRSLVADHPLNEWFHGQLIGALSRAGRRSEALQAYQHLRTTLNEELGLDPAPELQRLQHEVLAPPVMRNGKDLRQVAASSR